MKDLRYLILVAAAAAVAVRLWRRTRGRTTNLPSFIKRVQWPAPAGETALVARREVRERFRGRLFRVVTLILLGVVAAAIVIPALNRGSTAPQRVAAVGEVSATLRADVAAAARNAGTAVVIVPETDLERAQSDLRSGRVDIVIDQRASLLVATPIAAGDTSTTARLGRALATTLGATATLQAAGLTAAQIAAVQHVKPLPVHSLKPATTTSPARSTSVVGLVLVFVMLTQYNTWTLMGVMEEKSSRVVEVLLATVRPVQLLAGKLLGIGLVALLQAGLLVSFALVLGKAVGSDLLHGTAPLALVATLVWLVLGYAFYSWVYAAAGSMAERQDQVQSLALPLSAPLILGYVVALTAAGSGSASVFVRVLAFLPPTAPFAMPVLVGLGQTTWWQFLLSAVISVASTAGVALLAARVYRRAVLRTGRRVRLREVLPSLR